MDPNTASPLHSPHFLIGKAAEQVTAPTEVVVAEQVFDTAALRRIQACVTACENLTTAELEAGIIQQMQQTLLSVVPLLEEAQRLKAAHAGTSPVIPHVPGL